MANEIKTRIALKEDTLANWQSSVFNGTDDTKYLKKGEVAITTVTTAKKDDRGNIIHVPCTLIKVGDGTNKYDDLPWISALAADVYEWAKKNEVSVTGNGNAVTGVSITNDTLSFVKGQTFATKAELDAITDNDHQYQFSIVTDAGTQKLKIEVKNVVNGAAASWTELAKIDIVGHTDLTNALSNYYTKGEVDGLISGVEAKIPDKLGVMSVAGSGAVTATGTENVTVGLKLDNSGNVTFTQGTNGLKAEVDTGVHSVALAGGTNNGTLKLTVDGTATDNIAVTGLGDLAFKDSLAKADVGLGNVDNTSDVNKPVSTAQAQAIADALAAAKKYADDYDANTEYHVEYDSANKKIKLVAGADANQMEIPTDDFIKDGMISSVAISADGKNLVITWNSDAGKDVTNIPLTELVDIMTGVDGTTITVSVSADDKISAEVKAGSITTSHIAPTAGIVKTQLDASVQTSLGKADTALQAADIAGKADTSYVNTELDKKVDKTITVTGTGYLSGGGALSKNQTIDVSSAVKTKIDNGATAYGWGNHKNAGYLKANGWETWGNEGWQYTQSGKMSHIGPDGVQFGDNNQCVDLTSSGLTIHGDLQYPYNYTSYEADSIYIDDGGQGEDNEGHRVYLPNEAGTLALTKDVKTKRATALNDSYANGQVVVAVDQDVDGNITSEKKDIAEALSDSSNIQYLIFDCGSATEVV